MSSLRKLWGIDLGGTKIEGVVMEDTDSTTPLARLRVDTEAQQGYEHVLSQIALLVSRLSETTGSAPETVGIGTPGVLDPRLQTMKNCNSTILNQRPLKRDLENLLGIPVHMANDANCFALAEARWGAVHSEFPEAKTVFGVIMGTGVGGGIVMHDRIWEGNHGIAGEWGHNFLDESGGPCYCGKTGCVETILSGPSLQRYYRERTGQTLTLKEIVAQRDTNKDAQATLERLCYFFGKALSVVVNILDPDVVVIGGGVGNIADIYTSGKEQLASFIFNNRLELPVIRPRLGDSAGVFGAAALGV